VQIASRSAYGSIHHVRPPWFGRFFSSVTKSCLTKSVMDGYDSCLRSYLTIIFQLVERARAAETGSPTVLPANPLGLDRRARPDVASWRRVSKCVAQTPRGQACDPRRKVSVAKVGTDLFAERLSLREAAPLFAERLGPIGLALGWASKSPMSAQAKPWLEVEWRGQGTCVLNPEP